MGPFAGSDEMDSKFVIPIILLASLNLSACSGGDGGDNDDEGIVYTGSKSAATVNAINARDLAVGGTGGTNQAIVADSANNASPLSPRGAAIESNLAATLIVQLQTAAAARAQIAQQPLAICDPGSAELNQNHDGTEGTIVFANCVVTGGNGAKLNGTVAFKATISGSTITSLDMRYINFKVTYQNESQTINMTVECSGTPLSCDVFSDYVGLDGKVYRVEITIVINTAGSSFDVDAVVFHPNHGYFTIDASIDYNNCPGGVPASGTITLMGAATSTATVVFDNCDSFTVTHEGVPTIYLWADIL